MYATYLAKAAATLRFKIYGDRKRLVLPQVIVDKAARSISEIELVLSWMTNADNTSGDLRRLLRLHRFRN